MVTQAAYGVGHTESAMRNAIRKPGFLCPECRQRKPAGEFTLNPKYGFMCGLCSTIIRIS